MQYRGTIAISQYKIDREPIFVGKRVDSDTREETVIGSHPDRDVVNRMISEAKKDDTQLESQERRDNFRRQQMASGDLENPDVMIHTTPKHLPPAWNRKHHIEEGDDPMIDLKAEREGFPAPTTHRKATGRLDAFDVNALTEKDIDRLIDRAAEFVDDALLKIDPYLALRAALDQGIFSGETGLPEHSYYNLIGSDLYDIIFAKLADRYDLSVETTFTTPFKLRNEVYRNGLDLIDGARTRVSSLIDDLTTKRDGLLDRMKGIDEYLSRLDSSRRSTDLSRQQTSQTLKNLEAELELEIKKLTNYEGFLQGALTQQVGKVFESDLGSSPLSNINFNGAAAGGEEENIWDLAFKVRLEEKYDPDLDKRFDVDDNGIPHSSNAQVILKEAADKLKRKVGIIRMVFNRFLGAECEVSAPKKVRGQFEGRIYCVTCEFEFHCHVPVKDEDDIQKAAAAITSAMRDLMHGEFSRLATTANYNWRTAASTDPCWG